MKWYYMKSDTKERFGPFSNAELKAHAASGALKPTDFVWRQGMEKAVPASRVKGLFAPVGTESAPAASSAPKPKNSQGIPVQQQAAPAQPTSPLPVETPQNDSPFATQEDDFFPPPSETVAEAGSWEPSPLKKQRATPLQPLTPTLETAPTRRPTREDQLWEEGGSTEGFLGNVWSVIHKVGKDKPWIYFVIPPVITVPIGIVAGILEAINPIVIFSYIIVAIAYAFLGLTVFQCFKAAGVRVRILSAGYGVFTAILCTWAFTLGGMLWDYGIITQSKEAQDIRVTRIVMPNVMVAYVKLKAAHMTVSRSVINDDSSPDKIGNYLLILSLYVVGFICLVGCAWGPTKLNSEVQIEQGGF